MDETQLTAYRESAKAAKARADKATPGPWTRKPKSTCVHTSMTRISLGGYTGAASVQAQQRFGDGLVAIAELIEHCRTDIPTLATAVVELCAEVGRLQEERDAVSKAVRVVADTQSPWRKYVPHPRTEIVEAEKILNALIEGDA